VGYFTEGKSHEGSFSYSLVTQLPQKATQLQQIIVDHGYILI
jgi:hypothetical protein